MTLRHVDMLGTMQAGTHLIGAPAIAGNADQATAEFLDGICSL